MKSISKQTILSVLLSNALLLVGCSTAFQSPNDPLEPYNRGMMGINSVIDDLYVRPLSAFYTTFTPPPVVHSVENVFNNVAEVPGTINNLLQKKCDRAVQSVFRVALNSTLGVFGIFDVATELGIERHYEDLGQTFAMWGWEQSSYFVLPILGPSTFRDTWGMGLQLFYNPPFYLKPKLRNSYLTLYVINDRTHYYEAEKITKSAGVDPYALIRDAYLQNRVYAVNDGEHLETDDTFLDEPPE